MENHVTQEFLSAAARVHDFILDQVSGNIPTSAFRAANHPLGKSGVNVRVRVGGRSRRYRTNGRGSLPALPVNIQQSRELISHFEQKIEVTKSKITVTWGFPGTKHALTLRRGGTKTQVDRGFSQSVAARIKKEFARTI